MFARPQQTQEDTEEPQEDDRTVHAAERKGHDGEGEFVIADEAQQQSDQEKTVEELLPLIRNGRRTDVTVLLKEFTRRPVGDGLWGDDGLLSGVLAVTKLPTLNISVQSQATLRQICLSAGS
jgi:hypothetical protein